MPLVDDFRHIERRPRSRGSVEAAKIADTISVLAGSMVTNLRNGAMIEASDGHGNLSCLVCF
jgi:hypothetical protein